MLLQLGLQYGSEKAKGFTSVLFEFLFRHAVIEDRSLAIGHGSFPGFSTNEYNSEIINNHFSKDTLEEFKREARLRNCSLISIAPAGSLSLLLNCSSGMEPEFAIRYQRKTESVGDKTEIHDMYCQSAKDYMRINNTSILPDYFVCSADIHWMDRVDTQAIIQASVDTAVSSTVNLPNNTTVEEIEQLYLYAWKKGLKGITVFRDGCSRAGILTTHVDEAAPKSSGRLPRGCVFDVSNDLVGKKRKLTTGCGSLHVTAFFDPDNGDLMETYLSKGSQGGCHNFMNGLSRLISLSARGGIDVRAIADQLNSTGVCPSYAVRRATKGDTSKGSCCPMAVGNALLEMWEEMKAEISAEEEDAVEAPVSVAKNPCPQCGADLAFEGGCNVCKACGLSKCE